jgi:hypothetical protein
MANCLWDLYIYYYKYIQHIIVAVVAMGGGGVLFNHQSVHCCER